MSNDAAGFTRVTDRSVASPNGAFDAGLRPDPFPDRAASLLPGLLAATRTGLPPAGDDELYGHEDRLPRTHSHSSRPAGRTPDLVQVVLQILLEYLERHPIHTRRTPIGFNLPIGLPYLPLRNIKRLT